MKRPRREVETTPVRGRVTFLPTWAAPLVYVCAFEFSFGGKTWGRRQCWSCTDYSCWKCSLTDFAASKRGDGAVGRANKPVDDVECVADCLYYSRLSSTIGRLKSGFGWFARAGQLNNQVAADGGQWMRRKGRPEVGCWMMVNLQGPRKELANASWSSWTRSGYTAADLTQPCRCSGTPWDAKNQVTAAQTTVVPRTGTAKEPWTEEVHELLRPSHPQRLSS